MAENDDQKKVKSDDTAAKADDGSTKPKKQKTPAQIEREKARRKRRRKKKAEEKKAATLAAGDDKQVAEASMNDDTTPEIVTVEGTNEPTMQEIQQVSDEPAEELPPQEEPIPENTEDVPAIPEEPEELAEMPIPPDVSAAELEAVPESSVEVGADQVPPDVSAAELDAVPEEKPLYRDIEPEDIQIFGPDDEFDGDPVTPAETPEKVEEPQETAAEPAEGEVVDEVPAEPEPEPEPEPEEVEKEQENQEEAEAISKSIGEDFEALPVKQGFLGRLFDRLSGGEKQEDLPSDDELPEQVDVKDKIYGSLFDVLKKIGAFLIVILLIIGAFWLGSSLRIVERVTNLFTSSPPAQEQEVDEEATETDLTGLETMQSAKLFGQNGGDARSHEAGLFTNADYFGHLRDPIVLRETGITAAIFYGLGLDLNLQANKFVYYVDYLSQIQNIYVVDVYEVLEGSPDRNAKLQEFIDSSQAIFDEGNRIRREIMAALDDLNVARAELTTDKDRYEAEFFDAIASYEGERADRMLNFFVELTQTDLEYKAKANGLAKLLEDYEAILVNLKIRIEALQQNQAAIVSGVKVVEIPGSNVDLVIEAQ